MKSDFKFRFPAILGRQQGLSLIELVLVIVILGVGLSMLLRATAPVTQKSHTPVMAARAITLAQDLLEEIRSKSFEESGAPGSFGTEEASRKDYDDVDDYDDWGPTSPPEDLNGTAMTAFSSFTRSATICNVDASDLDTCVADGSTDYKKLAVNITWSEGDITVESLRSDH